MHFDEYKRMYKLETTYWWYVALHQLVRQYIKTESKIKKLKILDAGCGTGRMLEIAANYGDTEGIDFSELAVSLSKQRGLTNIKQADLNDWQPFANEYDIIICNDVLYHSAIKDDLAILQKFYTALKVNGIAILGFPAFDILRRHHDKVVQGARRYRKGKMKKELKNIGFAISTATYRLPVLFLLMLIIKLKEFVFKPKETESDLKPLSKWINTILLTLNRFENKLITNGIVMPFGSSLFVVAEKK